MKRFPLVESGLARGSHETQSLRSGALRREEVRNRLVRRVDWRFFLPAPRPGKTVCFSSGLLARAVESHLGHAADVRQATPGEYDLAVAVNPDRTTLRSAWAALRPGGACYTEWYSPLIGGAPGVRRRLEAAGFREVTCYWAWPLPSRACPRFWVPLEAPGALRYFETSRSPGRTATGRLAQAARRAAWSLGLRLDLLRPICAVARKPAHPVVPAVAGASGMNVELADAVRAGWDAWGFGPAPSRLSWLVLTGGDRSSSKVVGLVFAEPGARPRLAIKLARGSHGAAALMREAATLRAAQALRPDGVRGAPRVLFCREYTGVLALGQTAITGLSVAAQLRRENYRQLALKVTDWLIELAGRPPIRPRVSWWGRLVEPVVERFAEAHAGGVAMGLLRAIQDVLATLGSLPLVCEHGDFGPANVFVDANGRVAVADWEEARFAGFPAADLLYFLTYLAFQLEGASGSGRLREAYRASLDPSTLTGSVRAECLARYTEQIGLDPAALRPLSLLRWMPRSGPARRHLAQGIIDQWVHQPLHQRVHLDLLEEDLRQAPKHY